MNDQGSLQRNGYLRCRAAGEVWRAHCALSHTRRRPTGSDAFASGRHLEIDDEQRRCGRLECLSQVRRRRVVAHARQNPRTAPRTGAQFTAMTVEQHSAAQPSRQEAIQQNDIFLAAVMRGDPAKVRRCWPHLSRPGGRCSCEHTPHGGPLAGCG